jgi:hypothetical protein
VCVCVLVCLLKVFCVVCKCRIWFVSAVFLLYPSSVFCRVAMFLSFFPQSTKWLDCAEIAEFSRELSGDVMGDTSGDYQKLLIAILSVSIVIFQYF